MKRVFLIFAMALCLASCSTDKEYHIETSDGVILYAHVRGRGEPCLYLHGGPGSGSTWMKEMGGKELEKRFTMVYLDQRGACRSSEPADDNFSLSRQTLDFEEVREALGFDKWHLLGHSFGGILEIAYWRDYPESIRGMIFEDCTLSMRDSFIDSWLPAAIEIVGDDADPVAKDTTVDVKVRMSAIQRQLDNDTRALIFTKKENKHVSDTLNSWTFHKDCICHEEGDYVMGIEEYWSDFRPLASTVTVPVLFFVGKYDRAVGPDSWKGLQFPDAIIKIGDCGHFPFLESPGEWAAALDEYQNRARGFVGRPEPCGLGLLKSLYADMDGVPIHYKVYGEGSRTIAFVHGFGCDINCWEQQFLKFKDVIAGFAQSLAGPETPQPVSVICTQNSGLAPDNREKMEALYSDLDYAELETCGHFIQMEQPELVNNAIRKLIDRT